MTMKLVIAGVGNSGKTAIFYQLAKGVYVPSHIPTVGFNTQEFKYQDRNIKMWDVGGASSIRKMWEHYLNDVACLVFVVDCVDRAALINTDPDSTLFAFFRLLSYSDCERIPLLVYANKQDVPGAMSVDEVAQSLLLNTMNDRQWHIQPCSGVTGDGLLEGLDWVCSIVPRKKARCVIQ